MRIAQTIATLTAAFVLSWSGEAFAQDGRWRRAESPHFIVYGDISDRDLTDAVKTLESYDALLRALLQPGADPSPVKLEINVFESLQRMRVYDPDIPDNVAGFYYPRPSLVAAFAIYLDDGFPNRGLGGQQVLFHEYTHHFMLQNFPGAYPAWYVEGFAEYMQSADFQDTRVVIGRPTNGRTGALFDVGQLSIPEMLSPPRTLWRNPDTVQHFYSQSWLMVHYFFETPERRQKLRTYLAALRAGGDPVASFQPAFGQTTDEFARELRTYRNGAVGAFAYPRAIESDADVHLTRLPESGNALHPLMLRVRADPLSAPATLGNRIANIAQRYPDDAFAQTALGCAEILRKNYAHGREILQAVLAADPRNMLALQMMGISYMREAEEGPPAHWTETAALGRPFYGRETHIDANTAPALYYYALTYSHAPEGLPETALDALVQAHVLAPQVIEIRLNAARQLMGRGMFDEAISILEPAAFTSHASPSADEARRLLDLATQHQPPGETPPTQPPPP